MTNLKSYAKVLVDFALGSGRGVKKGEVVLLQYDQPALPLALAVFTRILEKKANPILKQHDENFDKLFFTIADDKQLRFFPAKYQKALVETIDHRIYLLADENPLYLKNVDPRKIAAANLAKKPLRQWLNEKEDKGKYTWTLALYGTLGLAKQAGLSIDQYWRQIEAACYLNEADPIKKWQQAFGEIDRLLKILNRLPIKTIRVQAKQTDLTYSLGEKRCFLGGSGRNIPSFEIFTSPDWRGTNGHIYFDLPLYRWGNVAKGIYLEFKNGLLIKAKAEKNESVLKQISKQKNANKVGEFSLTDKRLSKINRFMANTLYDENFGGKYGNTHLALGASYHDCYRGAAGKLKALDWQRLGFNDSAEHTDIIATSDRTVTVTLTNGAKKIIYRNGSFTL